EQPNELVMRHSGGPTEIYRPGHPFLAPSAQRDTRMPAGHPEGLLEAFANIYSKALRVIRARLAGAAPDPEDLDFATVRDGAVGVHFIHTALKSGREGGWVDASYLAPGQ
ncbi:MAG: gfo/Idh/MocA family oxidoreductase, partial [Gemmatimonadaceae bacterium]